MTIWIFRDIQQQPGVELRGLRDDSAREVADDGYLPPPAPGAQYDRPAVEFTGEPLTGYAPLSVQFTDRSSGPPTSWSWDFKADGSCGSNAQHPVFIYEEPGVYGVGLEVANAAGRSSAMRPGYITVLERQPPAPGDLRFFFGETAPDGQNAHRVWGPAAEARDRFLAAITDPVVETFEAFEAQTRAPVVLHGGMSTLNDLSPLPTGRIWDPLTDGRFNTTPGGKNYWDTATDFEIVFATPVKAFGFFGMDWGDFSGTLKMQLVTAAGVVDHPLTAGVSGGDGGLFFFGFVDTTGTAYSAVRFIVAQLPRVQDYLGFDDIIIGTPKA